MSKIICDICGTTYPDSANQCPICGCVKPVNTATAEAVDPDSIASRIENYTYVKGGRFSKKNVKKRNQRNNIEDQKNPVAELTNKVEEKDDGGKGLVIAIIVLLIAVIAVASYITIRFFVPFSEQADKAETKPSVIETTEETIVTEPTVETTVATIPCAELTLDVAEIKLEEKDAEYTLNVSVHPEDTTETITYNSENDAIATVSYDGKITAVSAGETIVTVTCGELSVQCKVVCAFGDAAGDSNSEFTAPYRLNKSDVSISTGEKFTLKFLDANDNLIPVAYEIANTSVCTMDGNLVTGATKGTTKISVTYEGETYSCIVRVVKS